MSTDTQNAHLSFEVRDFADDLDGAPADDLTEALGATLDVLYLYRGAFAWAATELGRALEYKGFSAYRRPFAGTQQDRFRSAATGGAVSALRSVNTLSVSGVARTVGIPSQFHLFIAHTVGLPSRFHLFHKPSSDAAGTKPAPHGLRLAYVAAQEELYSLRLLAGYEAVVARAHDTASGPKGVRQILTAIDEKLLSVAHAEDFERFDAYGALEGAGLPSNLTVPSFAAALNIDLRA